MPKILLCYLLCLGLLQGCAAVVVAGAAGGLTLAHDKRSTQIIVNDQSIEHNIAAKLAVDEELKIQSNINVVSYNGIVLLTGETPNESMRAKAEEIATNNSNVKRVYNALDVTQPSSLKSRNNDTWITTKVKTQLLGKKGIDGLRIKVVTENASVFLMGLVPKAQADIAADTVSRVTGVKRVVKVFEHVN